MLNYIMTYNQQPNFVESAGGLRYIAPLYKSDKPKGVKSTETEGVIQNFTTGAKGYYALKEGQNVDISGMEDIIKMFTDAGMNIRITSG